QGVRREVEAAEYEEDGHGEAGQDLGAGEAEGVAHRGAAPDVKVGAQHVDGERCGGGPGVKEDEVGEGGRGLAKGKRLVPAPPPPSSSSSSSYSSPRSP